ncbi:MAG: hypothetical protein IJD92_01305 [Bacilli bacterium]|nr:hypothetical protein [Bacilli bacterium]
MKNKIIIKILDNEIWLYKDNILYKEETLNIMDNNYITDYKVLSDSLKETIDKYKLSNMFIQNKIYILINKLYCETNLYILKMVLYNLGFSNYKTIYEEDLYKSLYDNIICIWTNNGIYLSEGKEEYIEIKEFNLNNIDKKTLLITSNKDILENINDNLLLYENTKDPIFKMIVT